MSVWRRKSLTFNNLFFEKNDIDEMQLRNSWQKIVDNNEDFQIMKILFERR